jgi:hypothetical protein
MRTIGLVASILLLSVFLTAQEAPVRESKDTATPDQMREEMDAKSKRVTEIEQAVQKMTVEANKEKDIKWKLCLDDIFATLRGISASVSSAKGRVDDLIRAEKLDAARTQVMLVRGLTDAAEKAFAESQGCPRQLTRVDNRSTVEREEDKDKTGTHGDKGGVGDAMGQDFTDAWATERDPNDFNTEDPIDGAGTDNPGGPTETPDNPGGDAGVIADNGDMISEPPFIEASLEK